MNFEFSPGSAIAVFLALLIYFVPTAIASGRNHHQGAAIFALNMLLGWTLLGWIAAFVWSLTAIHGDNDKVAIGHSTQQQTDDSTKTCPYCAEIIKREAVICRYCGKDLAETTSTAM